MTSYFIISRLLLNLLLFGIINRIDSGDQVILVVKNMRAALIQLYQTMKQFGFTEMYGESLESKEHFLGWRDQQILYEIHWFGFYIDYWMEVRMTASYRAHV